MKKLIFILIVFVSVACKGQVPGIGGMMFAQNTTTPIDSSFITEWNLPSGSFTFPTQSGVINCIIDWGDGTSSEVTTLSDPDLTHYYTTAGTYLVSIKGTFPGVYINRNTAIKDLITKVVNWGYVNFTSFYRAFDGANNLISLPSGPITGATSVKDFYLAFFQTGITTISADMFSQIPDLTNVGNLFNQGSLTSIPPGLFDNNPLINGFWYTFAACPITSIPDGLFDTQAAQGIVNSFYRTFYNCSNINSTIYEVWNDFTYLSSSNTNDCFYGCTNATNYSSIPLSWR